MQAHTRFLFSTGAVALTALGCPSGDDDGRDDINPPPKAVNIDEFTADQVMVAQGGIVTLTYKVSNATSVTISAMPGGVLLDKSTMLQGQVNSAPIDATTMFTLTAEGQGGPKTKTISVSVDADAVQIITFQATPNPTAAFSNVMLSWTTAGATSIAVFEEGVTTPLLESTTMVASGMLDVGVDDASLTFRLEAKNDKATTERTVTVTVMARGRVRYFRVQPTILPSVPSNVTVVWNIQGTGALTANGTAVPAFTGATTGTISVSVTEATVFELSAEGGGFTDRASLAVAPGAPEAEPNDTNAQATPITTGATGEINPMTDVDFYRITVANAASNIFAETTDGQGGCAFDSVLKLYDSTGTELGEDDDGGAPGPMGRCSQINPMFDAFARDLPAGDYFLSVESYNMGSGGAYGLVVIIGAGGCGNGLQEGSLGEQCDDGNTVDTDGCSNTCQVPILGTVTGLNQDQRFTGMIDPNDETDFYRVVMDQAGFIFAETGNPVGTCPMGMDTELFLYDDAFAELGGNNDIDFFGDNLCSRIDPVSADYAFVQPGTYFIAVTSFLGLNPIPMYELQIRTLPPGCGNSITEMTEQCDDGNAAAGDGCGATCQIEPAGTVTGMGGDVTVAVTGAVGVVPELIAVTVTAGQTITATTTDGMGGCPFATSMGLFGPDIKVYSDGSFGGLLGATGGTGGCAFFDARVDGSHRFAASLAAGTYYIAVIADMETDMGNVTVEVTILNPGCGNRIQEMGEQCDDGNLNNGDGCSSMCQFDGNIRQEVEPNNDFMTANGSNAALNQTVTVTGIVDPIGDLDLWRVTVPAMGDIVARTYPTFGDPMSCSFDQDTKIVLLNSTGMPVMGAENDDDDGRNGFCSAIDTLNVGMSATNLPAGAYFLQVQHFNNTAAFMFPYFMDIQLLP